MYIYMYIYIERYPDILSGEDIAQLPPRQGHSGPIQPTPTPERDFVLDNLLV